MKLRIVVLASSLPFLASVVLADDPAPSFAAGFDMLNALVPAQPAASAPAWHTLPDGNAQSNRSLRGITQGVTGNIWLIPPADGEPAKIIPFGQTIAIELQPPDSQPTPASIEKDIPAIIEAINKLDRVRDVDDFTRPWNNAGAPTFGPLLVFAAQVHRSGHPTLADQLAWALFQAAPNREVVVDAAINQIGDALYNDATTRFFETWDWQTYHNEISQLIQKLTRGWGAQAAVAMIAESVALRIAQPNPPAPSLDGTTIDPEALASLAWIDSPPPARDANENRIPAELAAMLAQIPAEYHAEFLAARGVSGAGGRSIPDPGFWLLTPPDESHPAAATLTLGIHAVPALAALVTDKHPVHFVNPVASSDTSFYFSHNNNPIERAIRIHQSIRRPATRGDIAVTLLRNILPDPTDDLDDADPNTLRELAIDFHQSHHDKNIGTLAATYITDGGDAQKQIAATFLAESTEPGHHQLFETRVLEAPAAVAHLSSVLIYAQQRKTGARAFLDQYLPKVREEIGDGTDLENMRELSWELRQPGHLNQMLRQLESLADGKSPEDSAREIAAGPPEETETAIQALLQSISSSTPTEKQSILLAGAVAATDPQIRVYFLASFFNIRDFDEEEEEESAELPTFTDDQRSAWTTLINDTRPIDPEWEVAGWLQADTTLGALAALAAEFTIDQAGFFEISQLTGILKTTLDELAMARIKLRLANEPLPILPDAENVTPDRLQEIINAAGEKPSSEIPAYLDALAPDERAAWFAWIQEPGEIQPPESVRGLAMTLIEENTNPENGLQPTPGLLNLTPGFTLHSDTIEAYIQELAANAATHSLCFGTIQPIDFPPGLKSWTLRATIPEEEEEEDDERSYMHVTPIRIFQSLAPYFQVDGVPSDATALIIIQFHSQMARTQGIFNWWVVDGKPVPFALSNQGEISEEIETTIAETLATARENASPFMLRIQVITRADAERLAEN